MELKQQNDRNQRILLWIIASILFHIILIVLTIFFKLDQAIRQEQLEKQQQQALTAQDPQQRQEELRKRLLDFKKPETFMLLPGRKAVLTDQPAPAKPKPKEEEKHESVQKEHHTPISKHAKQTVAPISKEIVHKAPTAQEVLQHLQDPAKQLEKKEEEKIETAPTIKKTKISLKDFKLGFSKFLQEGNTQHIIQYGNASMSADAQSLKNITYLEQIAKTMKEYLNAHPESRYITHHGIGKNILVTITIDRTGKTLENTLIQGCGDEKKDKILMETLQSIKMYPAMPQHIPDNPYSMRWTIRV